MTAQLPQSAIIARQTHDVRSDELLTLSDKHQRRFNYLRLSITDVCNFSCNYCLPDGYECNQKQSPLSIDEIKTLVSLMAKKGIEKVRITGGEPSTRKDLPEIIRTIKSINGIKKVALTTNGYKLDQFITSWVDAGLDAINVSIDSLRADRFTHITGHNRLSEILKGLEQAETLGLKNIKVNAVLLKQYNVDEIPDFLQWIKHKPYTLRFIELMETGDNQAYFEQNHISGSVIEEQLIEQGWQLNKQDEDAGPAKEYSHPDYQGNIGLIMPYSNDFCKSCNRLRISAIGKLHLCLFGEQGHDLKPYLNTNNPLALNQKIDSLMGLKTEGHALHEHLTGSTRHLAMLGG